MEEWDREVLDVVVFTTSAAVQTQKLLSSPPPFTARFDLDEELRVDQVGSDLANQILDACTPPGKWINRPARQYGELYSFVRRRVMPFGKALGWDEDGKISQAVALSRIVHPTSISFEFAARLVIESDGQVQEIYPGPVQGFGSEACLPTLDGYRNWLIESDLVELRMLLAAYTAKELPLRLKRAFWYFEAMARTCYADLRWVMLGTALEALVHTQRSNLTNQFKQRVTALANELGIVTSMEEADNVYDKRSSLAHGRGFPSKSSQEGSGLHTQQPDHDPQLYTRYEEILRKVLLKALQDDEFSRIFDSPDGIMARWPLKPSAKVLKSAHFQ